jgi:hypothetical protein
MYFLLTIGFLNISFAYWKMEVSHDKHLTISDNSRVNELRNKLNIQAASFIGFTAKELKYFVETFLLISDNETGMIILSSLKRKMEEFDLYVSDEGSLC